MPIITVPIYEYQRSTQSIHHTYSTIGRRLQKYHIKIYIKNIYFKFVVNLILI